MKNKVITSILVGIFIILIILAIILIIGKQERKTLLLNWKVDLPDPQNVERIIYNSGFQDGEVLEIYNYTLDDIERIIESEYFTPINSNKEFIKEKLEDYYNILDSESKEKFNKNINNTLILTEENYYYFIQDEDNKETYLLLIIDTKESKMYCLENIF